jgi:hypothetical protein
LIWKRILPDPTRFVSQGGLLVVMCVTYARMMTQNRIPLVAWTIGWFSIFTFTLALLEGQDVKTTLWGWFEFNEFLFVGLYVYLTPRIYKNFPALLLKFCVAAMTLQVLVQIGQYLTGEPIGDNLAGTFGQHGVKDLFIFSTFTLAITLGVWLAARNNRLLLYVLSLCIVANVLAENKTFLIALVLMVALALVVFTTKRGEAWKAIPYGLLVVLAAWLFVLGYNQLVPTADRRPIQEYWLDEESLDLYMNNIREDADTGTYRLARSAAIEYGWQTIMKGDWVTRLFGFGIGARTESKTLGLQGIALQRDDVLYNTGSSLLIMMQEIGTVGLLIIGLFLLWIFLALVGQIRRRPSSPATWLRYSVLIFSLLWPLWLWHGPAWTERVTILLYWATIGYLFREAQQPMAQVEQAKI